MNLPTVHRKALSEVVFGFGVLLLAAYQVIYQLPHSPHYRMKLFGIAVQAALGVFMLTSAALLTGRHKQRESSDSA